MVKDHCPLCKSKKLIFIDPEQSRNRLKELVKTTAVESLPGDVQNLISMLDLDKDMTEEERKFYEEHGKKVLCQCCGMTYYEFDNYDELENKNAKPVSYEEYVEYLKDHCDDYEFIDFVTGKSHALEQYYTEALDQLLTEFNAVSSVTGEKNDSFVN